MKTGINMLLWTTHVTQDHFPLLSELRQTGYDGVEVPLFEGNSDHYKMIVRELKNQGLACTTLTVVGPETNPISPDAAIRRAALDRLKWAIEMTAILGSETLCGPFHSALGVFSGTGPTDDEKSRAVEVLRLAAEFAKQHRIKLAIEYLSRFECYLLTTAEQTMELVRKVNHPNLQAMYDTFHANIEEKSNAAAIRTLGEHLMHVHVSENDRGIPGTGMIRWDETFRAFKEIKYDGWLMIEAFGRALPALAAATKIWRDLFPAPRDVCIQGLKFLREMWKA